MTSLTSIINAFSEPVVLIQRSMICWDTSSTMFPEVIGCYCLSTCQGVEAVVEMSPYCPLLPALGSLRSPHIVVSSAPEPEAPLFCLLHPVFDCLPQLGACDPKRLQEPLGGCSDKFLISTFCLSFEGNLHSLFPWSQFSHNDCSSSVQECYTH